jgi:O-antigen ligase
LNLVIVYFLIVKTCINEKNLKFILLMIVLAITYLSYDSVHNVILYYYDETGIRASGFGWYENPNDLVFILAVVLPLVFCLAELTEFGVMRYMYITICGLFTVNILMAGSRNGLLGLVTVGSLCLLFSQKISRLFRIVLLGLLMTSIIGTGIATVLTRTDLGGELRGDASSEDRIVQWKACLRMVRAHPILGIGPHEAASEMRNYGGVRGLVPHNTLIQVFAETGIPGGLFFVMCTIYPLWEAYKFFKINRDKMAYPSVVLYKYLIIALVGFWVCAFFSNRVYFKILYVLVALIVALRENILTKQDLIPTYERERPSVLSNNSSLQSN